MVMLISSIFSVVLGMVFVIYASVQIVIKRRNLFIILGTGSILTTLSFPFLINELYKFGSQTGTGYITLWETKDVLSFYGSFLAFIGTISLGGLALWQNKKFKQENDLSQKRIEKINITLLDLESSREKEKLLERYFLYVDETQNLFDPIYFFGMPEKERSKIEIFSNVLSCQSKILNIKRRLLFLDRPNANNVFFQYISEKIDEIKEIIKTKEEDDQNIKPELFKFWKKNSEEYNDRTYKFMTEIDKSIFGKK